MYCLIIINSNSHAESAQLQLQVSNARMQSDDDSGNDSLDVSHVRDVGIIIDVSYELHRLIREARYSSASLCRDERQNTMAATYNVLLSNAEFRHLLSSARLAPLREQCRDQNTHEQS